MVENCTEDLDESQELRYTIVEEDVDTLVVHYDGVKPGNFEEAVPIVAVGRYDDGVFYAEQLLVKCPSKYQGLEDDIRNYGSET